MKTLNRRVEGMSITHEKFQLTRSFGTIHLLLFLSFVLHGCAVQSPAPPPSPGPENIPRPGAEKSAPYSPKLGSAASLYSQAKASLAQGRYHQAELELERALRIEPRNGDYWHTMAKVKYQQNLYNQAVQFCLKSKSLAGRNSELIRLNDALIAQARQQQSN